MIKQKHTYNAPKSSKLGKYNFHRFLNSLEAKARAIKLIATKINSTSKRSAGNKKLSPSQNEKIEKSILNLEKKIDRNKRLIKEAKDRASIIQNQYLRVMNNINEG